MDLYPFLGYLSGLYLIKPGMDTLTLLRTASLVHIVDALLCWLVAAQSGRHKGGWTLAGLFLGIWALAVLFLLPAKRKTDAAKR